MNKPSTQASWSRTLLLKMSTRVPEPLMDALAAFFIAGGGSGEVSDAAIRALEAGLDSPTLRIVAGLSGWTSPSEIESYLGRVLHEFELPMPERSSMVRAVARPIAGEFLAGRISPDDFVRRLYELSRQNPTGEDHHPWCQLQDEWELARNGTYGTIEDAQRAMRTEAEGLVNAEPDGPEPAHRMPHEPE